MLCRSNRLEERRNCMTTLNRREFLRTALAGAATLSVLNSPLLAADPTPAVTLPPAPPLNPGGVVRADLSRAMPASALTRDFASNRWQLIDYETAEGVK